MLFKTPSRAVHETTLQFGERLHHGPVTVKFSRFARLENLYRDFLVTSESQSFNIEESGFSTRTSIRARAKAAMESRGWNNSI